MKKEIELEPHVSVFGQSYPRAEIFKLGLIALFFILMSVFAGAFLYLDWRDQQLQKAVKMEAVEQMEVEAAKLKELEDPLKSFFGRYLQQTGFDQVESIRAVGEYTVNDITMQLTFLAKRPRLYKQSLRIKGRLIEFGYDGVDVWFEQSHGVVDSSDVDLMNLNKALAILESTIPCLAWDYDAESEVNDFELMPDAIWQGHACRVVKNTGLISGSPVYHYIDIETGFEHYRRASIQISDKRFKDVELFYSQPLKGSSYSVPSGIELLLDGQIYYNVRFETVEVNKGIPTFLFRPSGK